MASRPASEEEMRALLTLVFSEELAPRNALSDCHDGENKLHDCRNDVYVCVLYTTHTSDCMNLCRVPLRGGTGAATVASCVRTHPCSLEAMSAIDT